MSNQRQARRIRAHKIGVLIRDARLNRQKSIEDCASVLGTKAEHFVNVENGSRSPSLPELELLSYYFDLPIEHFWGSTTLGTNHNDGRILQADVLIPLRQRMIGVMLRQAREKQNMGVEALSQKAELSEEQLLSYELGEIPIPFTDIQSLADVLGFDVADFIDVHGPYGEWRSRETLVAKFMELPEDLREFIMKPVNRPYMEIARRLSQLSTGELRQIAEGLLEITY